MVRGIRLLGLGFALLSASAPSWAAGPSITATDQTAAVAQTLARADAALAQGRPAEALSLYDRARPLDTTGPGVEYGRGRALELLGRPAEAAQAYRAALRRAPDHDGALAALAGLLGKDNPEAGLSELARLQARRPNDPYLATRAGTLHAAVGRWEAASTQFAIAAAALPEDAAAQHNLAVARDRLGDVAGAIRAYERVLELPEDPAVPLAPVRGRLRDLRNR